MSKFTLTLPKKMLNGNCKQKAAGKFRVLVALLALCAE
jgi:hypothetical protein